MTMAVDSSRGMPGAGTSLSARAIAWLADGLASLGERPGFVAPPWRVLLLRTEDQAFDVYVRKGKTPMLLGRLEPMSTSADTARLARKAAKAAGAPHTTVLRLAPKEVVHTRLTLPAGVAEVLGDVLRNQLESHAPWPADQALFAYSSAPLPREPGRIDVDLWVTGKARVAAVLAELARHNLKPGVVDFGSDPAADATIDLTRSQDQHRARRRRGLARLLTSVLLFGGLTAAAAMGWMAWRERELRAIDAEIAAARRSLNAAVTVQGGSELEQIRRTVLSEKARSPSMVILLEGLSRALPDEAFLERLEAREGRITLVGKANSAPALVGPLEASSHLADVHFSAPTIRQPGDSRESFTLSARIVPKTKVD